MFHGKKLPMLSCIPPKYARGIRRLVYLSYTDGNIFGLLKDDKYGQRLTSHEPENIYSSSSTTSVSELRNMGNCFVDPRTGIL